MLTREIPQPLLSLLLRFRSLFVLLLQAALVAASLASAWLMRFEFHMTDAALLWSVLPIVVVIRLSLMPWFDLMHGWWQYTGIRDAVSIFHFVLTGSVVFFVTVRYAEKLSVFPLSIYALEAIMTFSLLTGVRVFSRMLGERVRRGSAARRLLLIGAGHAAQMIIRETQEVETGYQVVGCLDDNPLKKGLRVQGVPVLGRVNALAKVIGKSTVDEVLIAIPSATPEQMRRLTALCEEAHVSFRTVPGIAELIAGRVALRQAREVSLTDLLGRTPVDLDLRAVREQIQGRVVMVTGAAGSIGSELCRQIRKFQPKLLICLDQNETGIFHLEHDLEQNGTPAATVFCVADFCNAERMRRIFVDCGVEIVFHAAAYKHVPVMEANIEEAVSNNVFGLLSLLRVAEHSRCSTFVMISSDKAVNPTNVMGCTKRIGELILSAWPSGRLRCVSTRFGNVLGSNGSAIPLFQEQIRKNQPITITHPEITRFFMTISEAVSLVLEAFAIGRKGETLVLDMGEPVRIVDLARTLARLSGKPDHELKVIGLRPGEKLFEELFYADERVFPSACAKIVRAEGNKLSWSVLTRLLDDLKFALSNGPRSSILAKLHVIVPQFTYRPINEEQMAAQTILGKKPTEEKTVIREPALLPSSVPLPPRIPLVQPEFVQLAEIPQPGYHSIATPRLNQAE